MLVFMYQIIIILINLFNIKAFEAQLVILVDDYLEYVIVDDQNKNLDNYQQTEAKTYSSNININYGSIIKITLSNYDGDFGLSAKLSFHNGKENEIYSTNDSYLWKINDTRFVYQKNTVPFVNVKQYVDINALDNPPIINNKTFIFT